MLAVMRSLHILWRARCTMRSPENLQLDAEGLLLAEQRLVYLADVALPQ